MKTLKTLKHSIGRNTYAKRATVLAMTLATMAPTVKAQDKVEATLGADLVSQYYWRGQDLGNISLQPTLGLSWKGLSLSAWGNVGISKWEDTKEFDLTLAYAIKGFHVGVTDYFFASADGSTKYFNYKAHQTAHLYEGNIGYDFGPVALIWYTNFAGNDYRLKDDGTSKRAYSSYVEATVPFRLAKLDWEAALGAVPYAPAQSVYANVDGFAVTNVSVKATKSFDAGKHLDIPVFAQIAANPASQKAYFVVGVSLQPKF